jgi:hypothetical protein
LGTLRHFDINIKENKRFSIDLFVAQSDGFEQPNAGLKIFIMEYLVIEVFNEIQCAINSALDRFLYANYDYLQAFSRPLLQVY